jgi:hypothetical protein
MHQAENAVLLLTLAAGMTPATAESSRSVFGLCGRLCLNVMHGHWFVNRGSQIHNLRKVGLTIELQAEHDRHGFRTAVRRLVALASLVLWHKERPATRRIGT